MIRLIISCPRDLLELPQESLGTPGPHLRNHCTVVRHLQGCGAHTGSHLSWKAKAGLRITYSFYSSPRTVQKYGYICPKLKKNGSKSQKCGPIWTQPFFTYHPGTVHKPVLHRPRHNFYCPRNVRTALISNPAKAILNISPYTRERLDDSYQAFF